MNRKKIIASVGMVIGVAATLASTASVSAQSTADVYLAISGGAVSIGVTGSLDLGTFTVSDVDQTVEGQFTASSNQEYFWVTDLKGADAGWYTTVQVSDMTSTHGTIPAANISMKADPASLTKLAGKDNVRVEVPAAWSTYRSVHTALTFIERSTGGAQPAGPNAGKLGTYGILPRVQVTIPAFQEVGNYTSTITYTLIEN